MERTPYQQVAIGAGILAIVAAIASGRMPQWLRVVLVAGLALLAAGAGVFAYRYATQSTTLTVAAGSIDGDAPRLMSAIAARLASSGSPIRLTVVDKGTALEAAKAFSTGQADLAIIRADSGDLSSARTVVTVTHAVVMLAVPPGSSIDSIDGLKGKTVAVIGAELNGHVVASLVKEYDLNGAKVRFQDVALKDLPKALQAKQVQAVLVVMPVSEKYLAMLRGVFPRNAKQSVGLVAIEAAGAIAAIERAYESYELPKGTLRGSPAVPDEDLSTLRVPFYLVANKKLSDDVVGGVTKAIMDARRDLVGEYPLLAQIGAPSTDKDALIPIHSGAAAYFDGDQKTIFDKYGDQFFYGSMLLGSLMSLLAAGWKFMTTNPDAATRQPLLQLHALISDVGEARGESDLAVIENKVNDILKEQLEKCCSGDVEAGQADALNLAIRRLEYLVSRRRSMLNGTHAGPLQPQSGLGPS
ncbi:MAG: ABC transporter substrate-binding protein [Xanthobacteraceae bacterium]|nr:ABC transporter substrate-binding protein [Xanthobacteraceae bacterium]